MAFMARVGVIFYARIQICGPGVECSHLRNTENLWSEAKAKW
jgi:hypothetical protein